jgi:hypothetical protein
MLTLLRYACHWLATLGVLGAPAAAASAAASPKVDRVVIIRDTQYLAKTLRSPGAFVAKRGDVYAARADLERYVWSRMKAAKSHHESLRWRQVLLKQPVYIWHCGGYSTDGAVFVYCTLSRYAKGFEAERFLRFSTGAPTIAALTTA